jgi:general secretion pathway protein H
MVELLVVLFLIGLMLSIAIPSFINTAESLKFKAAARQIVSTLKFARNTAVFKQRPQIVGFDIDNNICYIEEEAVAGDEEPLPKGKIFKLPPDVSIQSLEMVRERIESGKGNIMFYPDGSSSSGAITVKNKKTDEGFRIAVDIFTGLTHVTYEQ